MIEQIECFSIRLSNWFPMYLDSDKKILPLCYKYVIAMSSRKIKGELNSLTCVFRSLFKALERYLGVGADIE